jgi:predicted kinase
MVGLPGSGKTTYARKYLPGALRISLDDLRLMLTGRTFEQAVEPAVAAVGEAALASILASARAWRTDVVFDATNVTRAWRRKSLRLAEVYGIASIAVYVDTPLEIALARNRQRPHPVPDEVVVRFRSQLEPPDRAEGFADVITVLEFSA